MHKVYNKLKRLLERCIAAAYILFFLRVNSEQIRVETKAALNQESVMRKMLFTIFTGLFFASLTFGQVYPLKIGPKGRYLVDQNNQPFMNVGELDGISNNNRWL